MSSVSAFRSALSRFRKEEDGALIIFALMLFCLMIMIGGMAVDFMRYEWRRTALQNTLMSERKNVLRPKSTSPMISEARPITMAPVPI